MEAIEQVIKVQDIQDGDAVYSLVKSLQKGGTLQVFQNKEVSQEVKDGPAFTKCLAAYVDILEDRIPYQWKLEFEKKGLYSSSSTLKEFLDVCVHIKEAELQKPLRKMIACTKRSMTKTERGNIKTSPSCITKKK
eukprot:2266144-Ditylum_brightwellii.AAC.1